MTNYWGTAILIGNITYKALDVCLLPGRFVVQVLLASKRLRPASWKATKRCPAEATKDPKSQNLCSMVTMVYCIWLVVWNSFLFFPYIGIMILIDYFSEGLKPPTRHTLLHIYVLHTSMHLDTFGSLFGSKIWISLRMLLNTLNITPNMEYLIGKDWNMNAARFFPLRSSRQMHCWQVDGSQPLKQGATKRCKAMEET